MDIITKQSSDPSWEAAELYKQKKYREALVLLGKLIESGGASDWDRIRAGWCMYHTEFKKSSGDALIHFAHEILNLLPKDSRNSDLLIKIVVFKTVDALDVKATNTSQKRILELLGLLNPDSLSSEVESKVGSDGKLMEFASDKEKYFAEKTKALFDLAQWSECLLSCEAALKTVTKFHYDNDIWFKKRHAMSLKALGKLNEALLEMKEVAAKKHAWFIESDLAIIYNEIGDLDSAWRHAIEAAIELRPKDIEFGVNLFEFMGEILAKKQRSEEANKYYALAIAIRSEKGWKFSEELQMSKAYSEGDIVKGAQNIARDLRSQWLSERNTWIEKVPGKIKTIFQNGLGGFILGDDGIEYYFKASSFVKKSKKLENGMHVEFEIIKSFDKKKRKESLEAVHIQE